MKKTCLMLPVIIMLAIMFSAPSCWAKEKGYCYIVGYSLLEKSVYITPVFVAKVSGATYSEEEFVADIELIRKMERAVSINTWPEKGLNPCRLGHQCPRGLSIPGHCRKVPADEKNDFDRQGLYHQRNGRL